MGLISSLYQRGDESAAHYKRGKGDSSSNWASVPKNKQACNKQRKVVSVNKAQHAYECKHGYAPLITCLEDMFK